MLGDQIKFAKFKAAHDMHLKSLNDCVEFVQNTKEDELIEGSATTYSCLMAITITGFSTWSKYDMHSQWAVWLFTLPIFYTLLRTFTSLARLNASLNVK